MKNIKEPVFDQRKRDRSIKIVLAKPVNILGKSAFDTILKFYYVTKCIVETMKLVFVKIYLQELFIFNLHILNKLDWVYTGCI